MINRQHYYNMIIFNHKKWRGGGFENNLLFFFNVYITILDYDVRKW